MKPIKYSQISQIERRRIRLQYIEEQNGRCWHCQEDLNGLPPKEIQDMEINLSLFPKGFLQNPIHLHHCHETDFTIGAVHARCNAVLWQYYGK